MELSMEHFLDVIGIFVYHIQLLALLLTSMVTLMMILARVMLLFDRPVALIARELISQQDFVI